MIDIHGLEVSEGFLAVVAVCAISITVNAYYCCCRLPRVPPLSQEDAIELTATSPRPPTPPVRRTANVATEAVANTEESSVQTVTQPQAEATTQTDDENWRSTLNDDEADDEAIYVDELRKQMKRRGRAAAADSDLLNFIV